MPKVVFSCPVPFNLPGNSLPLTHIKEALSEKYGEDLTIISGKDYPYSLAQTLAAGSLFDELSSFTLEGLEEFDLFVGVGYDSLLQMREAKKKGTKCITTHFSTHYDHAYEILKEEYQKQNVPADREALPPLLRWRGQKEHSLVDGIIVPSQFCASTYEDKPLCRGKIRVANFGVDSGKFHPSKEPLYGFWALFSGGNWVRKGLPYLLQAWKGVTTPANLDFPGVVMLDVIGSDNKLPAGLPQCRNLGWVPEEMLHEIYREHNVFILPTLEEGQAMAVLEAMASGLCCIVTPESGAPIEDFKDGLIIPSRDAKKIFEMLDYLYRHPDEVKRLGSNAREKAEGLPWESFRKRVVEIVEEEVSG